MFGGAASRFLRFTRCSPAAIPRLTHTWVFSTCANFIQEKAQNANVFEAIRPTHAILSQISRVSVCFLEATGFSVFNRTWRELTARHSIINDVDGGSKHRCHGVALPAVQRMSHRMPLPDIAPLPGPSLARLDDASLRSRTARDTCPPCSVPEYTSTPSRR
jgi:hypothetical protein